MDYIDSHQHYWENDRFDYRWLEQGVPSLAHDYLPGELEPQLVRAGFRGSVLIQVLHTEAETRWMLELARRRDSILGVVGWVDLTVNPDEVAAAVEALRGDPKLVGIRHLVHEEPDADWLAREDVLRGLDVLEGLEVPFDLLLWPPHLRHVPLLSERLPGLRMVIDHIAKPYIGLGRLEPWRAEMAAAAGNPNVFCKLSGMITEADHQSWRARDLVPYVDTVMDIFGAGRVMFGSDWPVCTLAGSHAEVVGALDAALAAVWGTAAPGDLNAVYRDNATRIYGLEGAAPTPVGV